jgi:hypothetical protein
VILFHISNLYFDLNPVVANLAQEAGLVGLWRDDLMLSQHDLEEGKRPTRVAVVARSPADLEALRADPRWQPLTPRPELGVWSDDFSSILSVLR